MSNPRKLQMTDGTIVDLNTYIDMNNIYLDKTTSQSVPNIYNTIRNLVSTNAQQAYKYNFYLTNYRKRTNDSDTASKASPVSALITLGEPDTAEYVYIAFYLHIPGYTIAVYSNNTVVCNNTISVGDDHIVRSDVPVLTEELKTIINKMKRGGKLIYFNTSQFFNIPPLYWIYVPSSGAPEPISISEWFNDKTKKGSLTIVYIYWSSATSKSEASVVFTRDNYGSISINVGSPHA